MISCAGASKVAKVVAEGDSRTLRDPAPAAPRAADRPTLLVLALDGIGRDFLYDMLRSGELPNLAALLGGGSAGFPHAYFAKDVLTTVPSTTGVAWATLFTGVVPAQHGFTGNEFFVREKKQFAAPIPVSVSASAEALSVFTDGYANGFLGAPTIYERMRKADPKIKIWVSMSQFYRGADRLLMTRRTVLATALEAFLTGHTEKDLPRRLWADLDTEDVDVVVDNLAKGLPPDVLTLYLFGTDDWAHIDPDGPDRSRRKYLREVIEPALAKLQRRLEQRHALANRYVVVVSDHGHTQVVKDAVHALSTGDSDPPAVLKKAGFRVRPFKADVDGSEPFQSVLAYQGAVAYVYLADRSLCAGEKSVCDFSRPPRYEADVLAAAEAFYRNNLDGSLVPAMKGALDLVLVRRPVAPSENDVPFEVYVGDGRTEPLERYLLSHPHPTYEAFASRLRDLSVGPRGERAGDVLLLAHNGDRQAPEERYYFATPYHSWHGSPSQNDSRIPLIVAHPGKSTAELQGITRRYLGQSARMQDVGRMLVDLCREHGR